MAGKSAGQWIGTIAGAIIGFFIPGSYVALGAAIGGAIGGLIDPPTGPNIVGPRLDDLSAQTSTYGASIGRGYGIISVVGNLFWLEGDALREHTVSEDQGGKGGGGSTYESYTYSATFAIGLLRVSDPAKVFALRRLWIGTHLVFDAASDNFDSIIASNTQADGFIFYNGSDDQLPNARMQADKGAANVSAYPGLCYIVIEDLDLTERYSNSLPMAQVKAELVAAGTGDVTLIEASELPIGSYVGGAADGNMCFPGSVIQAREVIYYAIQTYSDWYAKPVALEVFEYRPGEFVSRKLVRDVSTDGGGWTTNLRCYVTQADVMCSVVLETLNAGSNIRFNLILENETIRSSNDLSQTNVAYLNSVAAVEGTTTWFAGREYGGKLYRFEGGIHVASSDALIQVCSIGYSENYVFCLIDGGSTEVRKFNKLTLALVATYTAAYDENHALTVINDDLFYVTLLEGNIIPFRSGVADSLSPIVAYAPNPYRGQVAVHSESPYYVSTINIQDSLLFGDTGVHYLAYETVTDIVAKLRDVVIAECGLSGIDATDIDVTSLTNSDVRGYRIGNLGSVRGALEQLQAAFPFDVTQSGYKVRFVSRGGSSVGTIPELDLGTVVAGEDFPVLLPVSREMDSQLPSRVTVRYLDPAREYDTGEQFSERPGTSSVSERSIDLALSLTSTEAAQIADVLISKDWVERREFGPFTIPPTWINLEPADVVAVEHRGQSVELRLTRIEYMPDGRIQCFGRLTSAQSYTSTATGEDPLTVGQSLVPLRGSTAAVLLDIPRIREEQDISGMAFGLLGLASGWPGGALLRSDDQGVTWAVAGAMNSSARIFYASAALSAHHGYSIDHGAVLTVTPAIAAHQLSSVTEDQLYAHTNVAAYGADGRWEIVSFKTVVDNTGSFTLSDFLRGLYGTEWTSGLHQDGDTLVMLDATTVGFFGLPTTAIGSGRLYRSVTQGAAIDSAESVSDTYDANNLKPLSPVDINGRRDPATLDWTIIIQRRSRWPVELFSGFSVPLGETSESYQCDVYDGSGYSTVKRTLSSSNNEIAYSEDNQVTDFGIVQETLYVDLMQISSVVGRGNVFRTSIYAYTTVDPFADQVFLFMMMEDTGLTDALGNSVSLTGNVTRSSSSVAIGSYSAYFDGNGDYLSVTCGSTFNLGTGDFTLEGYAHVGNYTSSRSIVSKYASWTANVDFAIEVLATTGKIRFIAGDGAAINISSNSAVPTGTNFHWAVCRASGVTRLFVNGTLQAATHTGSVSIPNDKTTLRIGANSDSTPGDFLLGYQDAIRFTAAARYTSSFAPPTSMSNP